MDFTKYYEAREKIIEIMGKDLLGPLAENEVIFGDRPLEYYVGIEDVAVVLAQLVAFQSDAALVDFHDGELCILVEPLRVVIGV